MAVHLYDDALVEKLRFWTKDTEINVLSPNDTKRLWEVMADKSGDKPIELPVIALSRPGGYNIVNPHNKPLSFDGLTLEATVEKSMQLNAIPIEITYQLDIYARYLKDADELTRNIVFNIINYPKLLVNVSYRGNDIEMQSNLRLASGEVQDNSDIPERLVKGQFTRFSILLTVDDAYLWDVRIRDNYSIDAYVESN